MTKIGNLTRDVFPRESPPTAQSNLNNNNNYYYNVKLPSLMKCPRLVEHQIAAFFHQNIHPRVLPLKLFSQRILLNSGSHYLQPVKEYIKNFVHFIF